MLQEFGRSEGGIHELAGFPKKFLEAPALCGRLGGDDGDLSSKRAVSAQSGGVCGQSQNVFCDHVSVQPDSGGPDHPGDPAVCAAQACQGRVSAVCRDRLCGVSAGNVPER